MRLFLFGLVLLCGSLVGPVFAQIGNSGQVTISGLERPIQPGGFALVHVVGMPEAEIQKASIGVSPSVPGILTVRLAAPSDAVYLVAVTPGTLGGKYSFSISLNPWREHLDKAVATPLGLDEADAKKLTALAAELGKKYTYWQASAVLEVTGSVPFPPDPPKPPPDDPNLPPPSKVTRVTFVYEKDQSQVPKPVALALQKLNAGGSVVASEFEEDTVSGNGQTPAQYVIALKAAREAGLPALVVQAGDVVLRVVKNVTTEQQVMDAAK